jgi:CubicO group peptidase (beta-lactamase class C family)
MLRRVVLAISLAAAPAAGQGLSTDSASRWIDSVFAPYSSRLGPGCAVGVARDGRLVFAKGYGSADLEHDTPITPSTPFYIASVSKQFTAMSIVLLAQDGRLSLDDSIRQWVPEVPSFGSPITLRQLLYHTSGLRDYFTLLALSGWPSDGPLTERQFLELISRQKQLNFAPGEEFLYSNTGYALLAVVVQRVSGKSLRDYAAEHIFRPLGMTHTEFRDDHHRLIAQRAVGYQPADGSFRISQPEFDIVGDGGLYSTVDDLAKWDANFRTGRVGGKAGIALLQEQGRLNNGQTIPYALGLTVSQTRGLKTYAHRGAYGGYRSAMVRYPDKGLSVITLCNTAAAASSLADEVSFLMLGIQPQKMSATTLDLSLNQWSGGAAQTPADSTGARRRTDLLSQAAGDYRSDELELAVTLVARDGVLVLQRGTAPEIRFVTLSDDWFTNSDQMLLRVVRDDHGAVRGFTLSIGRVRDLVFDRATDRGKAGS